MSLSAADYSCIFANVVVFCVFQCVFFYFVASRQYDDLLNHKMRIIEPFLERERPGRQLACERLLNVMGNEEKRVKAGETMNGYFKKSNRKTIVTFAGPYIATAAVLAAAFARRARMRGEWQGHHTLAYVLLIFCFTTEIFYYLGVVRTYRVLGDWEMVDRVFEAVAPDVK